MTELMADAKKLTVRNPDGSIKIAGFVPLIPREDRQSPTIWRAPGAASGSTRRGSPSSPPTRPGRRRSTWQKQLVDWYGYDNISKFSARTRRGVRTRATRSRPARSRWCSTASGARRSSSATPKVDYGTAPFPAADNQPQLYGSGRVGGTIVGIPQDHQAPARGVGSRQVHGDRHRLPGRRWRTASATCRRPRRRRSSPDLHDHDAAVQDVRRRSGTTPSPSYSPPLTASGAATPHARRRSTPSGWRARCRTCRPACSRSTSRSSQPALARPGAVTIADRTRQSAHMGAVETGSPAWARQPPAGSAAPRRTLIPRRSAAERRRMRRRSALRKYGVVLLLLSPWIIGFIVFTAWPDGGQPVLVVHPLRHGQRAALGRPRQLPVHVRCRARSRAPRRADPYFWQAVRNTRMDHRVRGAAARGVRDAHRHAAHPAQARRERLPDALLHAVDGAQGRPPRSSSSTC